MTRIAVGGFLHETNTFAPTKATFVDFQHGGDMAETGRAAAKHLALLLKTKSPSRQPDRTYAHH